MLAMKKDFDFGELLDVPFVAVLFNTDGTIREINDLAVSSLRAGVTREMCIGREVHELLAEHSDYDEDELTNELALIDLCIQTGKAQIARHRIVYDDDPAIMITMPYESGALMIKMPVSTTACDLRLAASEALDDLRSAVDLLSLYAND